MHPRYLDDFLEFFQLLSEFLLARLQLLFQDFIDSELFCEQLLFFDCI